MSYNGSGTFQINTSGQPVVAGTVISSTAFNALTADLATGLSTAITKDGQTATTARIPFAAGISSTLTTDSSSVSTGSIITAGGVGIAKALYVGTTANIAGVLSTTSPNITTSITTPSTSFDLINATATTLNLGGAATAVNVGAATGTMTVANTTLAAKAITASTTLSVTGVTTVQAGTAALPAIVSTTGTADTGIWFPAADTVAASTAGTERMRIPSTGGIQSVNCISVGNATPSTSGAGITFPATVSLSTDANTLDDYEEGTWTPSLGGNTTYTGRSGTYTKIGNTVRVYLEITVNLIGTGSTTTMSGFPFSPVGNDAGCVSYFDTLNASVVWLTIQMQGGGNCVFAGTTAAQATIFNGIAIFKNGSRILGTAVYQTSS